LLVAEGGGKKKHKRGLRLESGGYFEGGGLPGGWKEHGRVKKSGSSCVLYRYIRVKINGSKVHKEVIIRLGEKRQKMSGVQVAG